MSRFLVIILLLLVGCAESLERIQRVGKSPEFTSLDIPATEEDEEEVERRQQKKAQLHSHMRKTNSLWQPGAKRFFTDSRAWQVGDIITVNVEIQDSASLNNSTQQKRDGSDDLAVPKLFGKENALSMAISGSGDNSSLVATASKRAHSGSGNISRKESIKTEIAAIVTKILPNGNLFIQGRQEVRVNYELRDVRVAGIIRPKDISSTNSIKTNQMAEARISYGGRGVVSDVQQPRVGSQIIDIISPF